MSEPRKIRKKPCPYCEKKLQAPNKLKWRNNLARHLANACAPYQREHIGMMSRIACSMLEYFCTGRIPEPLMNPERQIAKEQAEVAELEKLYSASESTDPKQTGEPNKKAG